MPPAGLARWVTDLSQNVREPTLVQHGPQALATMQATLVLAGTVSVSSMCATPMPTATTMAFSSARDPTVTQLSQRPASGETSSEEPLIKCHNLPLKWCFKLQIP